MPRHQSHGCEEGDQPFHGAPFRHRRLERRRSPHQTAFLQPASGTPRSAASAKGTHCGPTPRRSCAWFAVMSTRWRISRRLQPTCNPTPGHRRSPDGQDDRNLAGIRYGTAPDGCNGTRRHRVCVTTDQKVGGSSPSGRAMGLVVLQQVSAFHLQTVSELGADFLVASWLSRA